MIQRNQSALGVDLSDRTGQFCRMTVESGIVAEGTFPLTPSGIVELWKQHGHADVVVVEAGAQSAWVRDLFDSLGARVIVADPRKLKAVTDAVRKSDRRDARMLARLGLADEELLSPTWVRSPEARRAMTLLKLRDQQVRARTATVNAIRSQVKLHGGRLPKCDADHLDQHEDEVPPELKRSLAPLFKSLRYAKEVIADLEAQIQELAETFPIVAKLAKVQGVGPITALAFAIVVGDPARFPRTRDIGAYLGLVPRRAQSGAADPQRGISKAGCGFLRRCLVQGAQSVLRRRSRDTTLRRWGLARLERQGEHAKRRTIVAVARKLAVTLLSIWKSGQEWEPLRCEANVVPQPVVPDECDIAPCGSDRVAKNAPSLTTRTPTCTGPMKPTESANGSMGRGGTRRATTPVGSSTRTSRTATPSAPAAPACAGGPANLDVRVDGSPQRGRGRCAAEERSSSGSS